jgi:hypothetical protein
MRTCACVNRLCIIVNCLQMQGKPSRSLQAAWKLMAEGGVSPDDVVHLERGLYGWYQAELPIDGEQLKRVEMLCCTPYMICGLLLFCAVQLVPGRAAHCIASTCFQRSPACFS